MIPVAQIKKDLLYSQELSDIIDALKMISSVQFRNLFDKVEKEDIVKENIKRCFRLLSMESELASTYFNAQKGDANYFLLFCSDEGFLGELNRVITEAGLRRGLKGKSKYLVMGERGGKLLESAGVDYTTFTAVESDITLEKVQHLSNYILDLFINKKVNELYVVYMKFISFTKHEIDVVKLIPCDELTAEAESTKGKKLPIDILVEPSPRTVIEYLIKIWLEETLYGIFWSSKLSEWAIRVMHLEQSYEEIKEITKNLKFTYFKSVHALNDKNIREIFSARAAL